MLSWREKSRLNLSQLALVKASTLSIRGAHILFTTPGAVVIYTINPYF